MKTGIIVGLICTLLSLLWVANPWKATTGLSGGIYDALGSWVWFGGSRSSYVQFMRWGGCIGVAIGLVLLIASLVGSGQADQLPPGMASRITTTGDVFSLAVPEGWSDVTNAHGGATATVGGESTQQLVVAPAAQPSLTVTVNWDTRGTRGLDQAGQFAVAATIGGESVTGFKNSTDGDVAIAFEHTLTGTRTFFYVTCSPDLASHTQPYSNQSDPCLGIIDSWRWETPSSGHVGLIVAGAVVLVAGSVFFAVHRSRRRRVSAAV